MLHAIVSICMLLAGFGGVFLWHYFFHKRQHKLLYNKLGSLMDCPFKFSIHDTEYNDFIVFELDDDTTLWCDFRFGIRSDGVYDVKELTIMGINGKDGSKITLNIGQSIFPIIQKMDTFYSWTRTKVFKTVVDNHFSSAWNEMKKDLDNLAYLELKSKEAEEE